MESGGISPVDLDLEGPPMSESNQRDLMQLSWTKKGLCIASCFSDSVQSNLSFQIRRCLQFFLIFSKF